MECKRCGIDKPEAEFYRFPNYISHTCKTCYKKRVVENKAKQRDKYLAYGRSYYQQHKAEAKKHRDEYREMVDNLKTPCVKCGDPRLYVIDFHHVDPSEKSFNINRKTAKSNFSIIENEVKKCVCLCRNCHMEFHYFFGTNPDNPKEALQHYLGRQV